MKELMAKESNNITRTKCICPRCNKTHILRMDWTGTCKPRVFCKMCMLVLDTYAEDIVYKTVKINDLVII